MKGIFGVAVLGLMLAVGAAAQNSASNGVPPTNQGSFSLTSQALALPVLGETLPATDIGATYALTDRLSLRDDNLMAPGANMEGYFGGIQYFMPTESLLAKTKLNPSAFQLYVTGSVGVDDVSEANGPTKQHIAVLAGGGLNYDPTGTGKFSVNLVEVRYARLPGVENNTAIVASGLRLSF